MYPKKPLMTCHKLLDVCFTKEKSKKRLSVLKSSFPCTPSIHISKRNVENEDNVNSGNTNF